MPYIETHKIVIGPVLLPEGVDIVVDHASGGQVQITVVASTATSKDDTVALLEQVFALVMAQAAAEGVGQPVFAVQPAPVPPTPTGPTA